MSDLNTRLLAAHAAGDLQGLIALYAECADGTADETAQGFFLTHAMVFALEMGDARATALRDRLVAMGREEPYSPDT